jgi:hypothetical protein
MFLDELDKSQASALLAFARELMASDGIESDDEEAFYERIVREMDAHTVNPRMFPDRSTRLAAFDGRRERLIALIALQQMAYIDGTFSVPEIEYVTDLADDWSISEEKLAECENFVLEMMMLRRRGLELLSGEEEAAHGAADELVREEIEPAT